MLEHCGPSEVLHQVLQVLKFVLLLVWTSSYLIEKTLNSSSGRVYLLSETSYSIIIFTDFFYYNLLPEIWFLILATQVSLYVTCPYIVFFQNWLFWINYQISWDESYAAANTYLTISMWHFSIKNIWPQPVIEDKSVAIDAS